MRFKINLIKYFNLFLLNNRTSKIKLSYFQKIIKYLV